MQTVKEPLRPVTEHGPRTTFAAKVVKKILGRGARVAGAAAVLGIATLPGVGASVSHDTCLAEKARGTPGSDGLALECQDWAFDQHEDMKINLVKLAVDMQAVCAQCTPPNVAQGRPSYPLGPVGANWATLRGDTAARQEATDDTRRLAPTDAPVRRLAPGFAERSADEQIGFAGELVAAFIFLCTVGEAGRGAIMRRLPCVEPAVEDTSAASVDPAGSGDQEPARVAPGLVSVDIETPPRIDGRDDGSVDVVHPEAASGRCARGRRWAQDNGVRALRWAQGNKFVNAVGPEGLQLLAQIVLWAYMSPTSFDDSGRFKGLSQFCVENSEVVGGQALSHAFSAIVKCMNDEKLPFLYAKGDLRDEGRPKMSGAEAVGYVAEFGLGTYYANGASDAAQRIYRWVVKDSKKDTRVPIDFNSLSPQQKAKLREDVMRDIEEGQRAQAAIASASGGEGGGADCLPVALGSLSAISRVDLLQTVIGAARMEVEGLEAGQHPGTSSHQAGGVGRARA